MLEICVSKSDTGCCSGHAVSAGAELRVRDEYTVVGPPDPRRTPVRIVGRHEGLHVRQSEPRRPVLWRIAAASLDGPGHPGACMYGRAHCSRCGPLAADADHPGCDDAGGREPAVRRGARQVPRGHAYDHERRAGPLDGVRRVRPDVSKTNPLTGDLALCTSRASAPC